ncbi:MAG: hypothetical protein ACKVTZ_09685 [Bacteroidia bacterium]
MKRLLFAIFLLTTFSSFAQNLVRVPKMKLVFQGKEVSSGEKIAYSTAKQGDLRLVLTGSLENDVTYFVEHLELYGQENVSTKPQKYAGAPLLEKPYNQPINIPISPLSKKYAQITIEISAIYFQRKGDVSKTKMEGTAKTFMFYTK